MVPLDFRVPSLGRCRGFRELERPRSSPPSFAEVLEEESLALSSTVRMVSVTDGTDEAGVANGNSCVVEAILMQFL
jgi:hypothetical protein